MKQDRPHLSRAADRVRKLRAKAESTTFPAEEAALRAKADELMARYELTEADVAPIVHEPTVRPTGPVFWPGQQVVVIINSGWGNGWSQTGTPTNTWWIQFG